MTHKRKMYDIVALLGDLGGVTEVLMLILGFILFQLSESSYNMMSTQRMFMARTKDEDLFDAANEEKKKKWFMQDQQINEKLKGRMEKELKKHRVI